MLLSMLGLCAWYLLNHTWNSSIKPIIPFTKLRTRQKVIFFQHRNTNHAKNTITMVIYLQYLPIVSLNIRDFYIKICTLNTVITLLICRNKVLELTTALSIMSAELASGNSRKIMKTQVIHHLLLILFIGLIIQVIGDCYLIMESLVYDLLFLSFSRAECGVSQQQGVLRIDFFNQIIHFANSFFWF